MKPNSANWRETLPIHPAAELLPRMTKEELLELGNDIKANGLISPIVLCGELIDDAAVHKDKYSLLDGISRLDAMDAVGLKFKITAANSKHPTIGIECDFDRNIPEPVIIDGSEVDPYAFVLSANLRRRHLTIEQKHNLIAKVLKAQPEKSNRTIAKQTNVDDKTVAAVRGKLEATAGIPKLTKTVGADGKARTTTRKNKRRDIEDHIAEKKARTAATKDDDAPGLAPHQNDPNYLISQFAEQVRSSGLDIAREVGATHRPMLVARLREVIDEIELEAERWAKEAHQRWEMPDIPIYLWRSAP